MTRLFLFAAAAAVILISTPAQAKNTKITCFSGDRVTTCEGPKIASRKVGYRVKSARAAYRSPKAKITHQRRFLRVDKPQEYVQPVSPSEKMVTREAYEKGSGIVRSQKTGATARVSPKYAPKFQAFIDALESQYGATIMFMGGYRRGPCANYSQHPCGAALDYCQLSRGRVDGRCRLPGRSIVIALASRLGLEEGGQWCHHDYGHVQGMKSAGPCGSNIYSAVSKFKALRHHWPRHHKVALR